MPPVSSSLEHLSIFSGVSKDRLARFSSGLKEEVYDPNEVIYRTGDSCDGLYVVTAGAVLLRNETPGQPIDRVLDVALGEVFGEMSLINVAPATATIPGTAESRSNT